VASRRDATDARAGSKGSGRRSWSAPSIARRAGHEVLATDAVTIEEYEDEGAGFIFDVGNGQLFFLNGQQYPARRDTRFRHQPSVSER
jgi:hypothetical protein